MEGISLKSLSAEYLVKNKYSKGTDENSHSVFSCVFHLNVVHDDINNRYNYTIRRADVQIDGKPVKKLMDRIICEIGNSIYPISLVVTPQMQIIDVNNYEDIKKNWADCTKTLLKKYPSYAMSRYVKMSEKNILDKNSFIQSLYQDTFFNAYFRDIYTPMSEDEACSILWRNFPKRQMSQTYLYQINSSEDKIILSGNIMQIVPEQEGYCTIEYKLGEKGEILDIKGKIESKHDNKLYKKEISVKSENLMTESLIL